MAGARALHPADYLVFAAMLVVSLGIGIYYSISGGGQKTTSAYLMGNRQLKLIPTTLSLMVSYISSIMLLGIPAEQYAFGCLMYLTTAGQLLGAILSAVLFVDVFWPLKLTSVNEYLEMRYQSQTVKFIGAFCSIVAALIYTGNVFFGPSTAIEAVTGFPAWASILIASVVSVVYTSIGGIRAVIWTDVFQACITVVGVVIAVIMGCSQLGFNNIWEINKEWGRLNMNDFSVDPTQRTSVWTVIIGQTMLFWHLYGYNQAGMQRYCAMSSKRQAKLCIMLASPGSMIMLSLSIFVGMVCFAYYTIEGCDPLRAGYISNPNQIFPYFVLDIFKIPGLVGIFISSVCAAALSTASSNLNSAAANAWRDILRNVFPNASEEKATIITKLSVLVLGILATLMAFGMMGLGGTLMQMFTTFSASMSGPLGALFLMGILMPWIDWLSASVGSVVGVGVGIWIGFGAYSMQKHTNPLPSTTANCTHLPDVNTTWATLPEINSDNAFQSMTTMSLMDINNTSSSNPYHNDEDSGSGLSQLFSMTFLLMHFFLLVVTIIVAVITNLLTCRYKNPCKDPALLHPWIRGNYGQYNLTTDKTHHPWDDTVDKVPTNDNMSSKLAQIDLEEYQSNKGVYVPDNSSHRFSSQGYQGMNQKTNI